MNRLNMYFFGEENISFQDGLYFYGINLLIVSLLILVTIAKF